MNPDRILQKLKRVLQALRYFLLRREYRIILRSGLFDSEYYRDRVPGLQNSEKSPLIHYIDFGVHEGKSPSPLFDPDFYRKKYGVAPSEDPFIHYLIVGMAAGNRPCRWFDPEFYREQCPGADTGGTAAVEHYLKNGRQQELYPNRELFSLSKKPVISIIVPVYNVSAFHVNNCIRSVVYQSYPHWELCLLDDCSSKEHVRPLLRQWASRDKRIKVGSLEKNSGISTASNAAAALASGDFLGFLDNDDELAAGCLARMVKALNEEDADLYYTDEDLIGEDGRQFSVFRKPGFNPELLLCHNYITHFVVAETALFHKVGGFDPAKDGAQDYDLLLKMTEQANKVVHIPEVLYHWRASDSSTSVNHEQKSYAHDAGKNAVKDALERRKIPAVVESGQWKFFYRVTRTLTHTPPVSVLILWRGGDKDVDWLSDLVGITSYPSVHYHIMADPSLEKVLAAATPDTVHILAMDMNSSEACLYNEAVGRIESDYVVFLAAQMDMSEADWLQALLRHCMESDVAVAGGMVRRNDESVPMTTLPDPGECSTVYYSRFVQDCSRHMNGLHCSQNVSALSWELMMADRNIFLDHGGFDEEHFPGMFADTDYCLRIGEAGYLAVFSPSATGELSAGHALQERDSGEAVAARVLFQKKWAGFLQAGDPFYNRGVVEDAGIDVSVFRAWYAGEHS